MTNEEISTLLTRAKAGERLSSTDRQQCVRHLLTTDPKLSNVSLGRLFGVTEGQVRADKKRIAPKVPADLVVTFTPSTTEIPPPPEGFEIVVTEYTIEVPYDAKERARLLRNDGRRKQKVRANSILRMSLAAIAADMLRKGSL